MMVNSYYYHKGDVYKYATGKKPAPPLPFVPLASNVESINQQLAAIRTITAMDTQHMADGKEDDNYFPDLRLSESSHLHLKAGLKHMDDLAAADREKAVARKAKKAVALSEDTLLEPMKRMSVALPPEVAALLEHLATSQGVTQVEALRMAIKTEAFLQGEIRAGCKVLLVGTDGTQKEVVFR